MTKATAVKPREDRTKLGLQTLGGSQNHGCALSSLPGLFYCRKLDVTYASVSGKCHKQEAMPGSLALNMAAWQDTKLDLLKTLACEGLRCGRKG